MGLDRSLNSAPPLKNSRRFDFLDLPSSSAVVGSWKKSSRRSKRRWQINLGDDELSAARLVMLARTGGGPYPSPPAKPAVPETTIPAAASLDYSDVKISQESVPTTPSPPPPLPKSYRNFIDSGKGFNSYQALDRNPYAVIPTIPAAAIERNPYAVIPAAAIDRNPYAVIPAVAASSTKCNSGISRSGIISFTNAKAARKPSHRDRLSAAISASTMNASSVPYLKRAGKPHQTAAQPPKKMIRDFDLNLPQPPDQDLESALPPAYEQF